MYRLVEGIDRAAIEADTAKAAHKLVAAANFDALAEGSIPDRKAKADVETADEAAIVDLAKHVYQRLRGKLEAADKLFDAIRKVMSSHDQEQKTFRSDANG